MNIEEIQKQIIIKRLTAMWALSEAALGGLLHALKVPFTGLFVGGVSVIFISLIGYFSDDRTKILKSTIIVILIKAAISPHVPLTAHFSVLFQGLMGFLFLNKSHIKISNYLLATITMLFSAFQKIFTLTVLMGQTLWQSIDVLGKYILEYFSFSVTSLPIKIHFILILFYFAIHLIGAIIVGNTFNTIIQSINKNGYDYQIPNEYQIKLEGSTEHRIKKHRFFKFSNLFLLFFASALLIVSYNISGMFSDIIIMFIRSLLITFLWYLIISPLAIHVLNKFLLNHKNKNAEEFSLIIDSLPEMKRIIHFAWQKSKSAKRISRIKYFLIIVTHNLFFQPMVPN